jgi:exodeoxyribonuclease VII large subunit
MSPKAKPASAAPLASQGDLFGSKPEPAPPESPAPAPAPAAPVPPRPKPPVRTVLTVGELTQQLKGAIEGLFPRVLVRGEISGFRGANTRGHLYFTLKDQEACLDAKIWASTARGMRFALRDGLEVVAEGSVDLYAPQGRYSLIISRLEPAGEGALALAFQQLKERLTAEGLMGEQRKRAPRPIPFWPRRIGVVTSKTGAALQDFLRVLHARNPKTRVLLCDARVQGEGATDEVVRGIERLNRTDVDVIVVTRGGGSLEDLWTFNEEAVARAIFASKVPVVSAIGHEVDFTIADFVADLRCPTPSAAAERLAPVYRELELGLRTAQSRLFKAAERHVLHERRLLSALSARLSDPRRLLGQKRLALDDDAGRIEKAVGRAIKARRERLRGLAERLDRVKPQTRLAQDRKRLSLLGDRLVTSMWSALERRRLEGGKLSRELERKSPQRRVHLERDRLAALRERLLATTREQLADDRRALHGLSGKLDAMSPLKVLARGYAVVFGDDGHLVRRASDVRVGEHLRLRLAPQGCERLEECDEIAATVTQIGAKGPGERS